MSSMLRALKERIIHRAETKLTPGPQPDRSLVNPGPAPVDQKRQYDHEQYSSHDPNDGYVIHFSFSFFLS